MRRCRELVCLGLTIFCVVQAKPIRQKRGYEDNFNVLLNLYKMNPLKQSNVFKSFSDRILLPRPSPDSNNNGKESAEEKKVNTTKEIKPITNIADNKIKSDNKNTLYILKDKIRNDFLIHDLNMKLDTMSAEIINILELLGNNKTQTERTDIKNHNNSQHENVENKSNLKDNMDDKNKSFAQTANSTQRNKNSHLQSDDTYLNKNLTQYKIQNLNKTSLDSLNYNIPGNRLRNPNFAQNGKVGEKNMLKYGNNAPNTASVPELKIYSEEYLKNTIFYDDDFDNDRAYKVQDNEITDKDRYVNAEVVIF